MNKKTLTQKVLDQLEKAEVVFDEGAKVRASADFWERYPDGHYAAAFYYCIEEQLSCLSEDSLQKILELVPFCRGIDFHALWRSWGQAGCFKCEPTLLIVPNSKAPVLRIRHDSYLHYMRGYAFQNSYDAYCNGSNGASSNLDKDIRAITWSEYSLEEDQDEYVERDKWQSKWALFRKAMIVQHPFVACGGRQTFYAMLDKHPDLFERFISLTDERVMHLGLDPELTLAEMRKRCNGQGFDWRRGAFELALMNQDKLYGSLRFGETGVSFSWRRNGETYCSTISFPEWDKQSYFEELRDIGDMNAGHPAQLSQREYLRACWNGLATMLLSLEGISVSPGCCAPRRGWDFESTVMCLITPDNQIRSLNDLWDKVSEATKVYSGYDDLVAEFTSNA